MKKISWSIFLIFSLSIAASAQVNKIVFVCEHGSAKSVIAAAYFNKLAREKNISWEAVSRGTSPDASISQKTKKLLSDENLFDESFVPKKISKEDIDTAQLVITFFALPAVLQDKRKTRSWQKVQSVNEDFQKLRDDIVAKLAPLIDSIANHKTLHHE